MAKASCAPYPISATLAERNFRVGQLSRSALSQKRSWVAKNRARSVDRDSFGSASAKLVTCWRITTACSWSPSDWSNRRIFARSVTMSAAFMPFATGLGIAVMPSSTSNSHGQTPFCSCWIIPNCVKSSYASAIPSRLITSPDHCFLDCLPSKNALMIT